MQQRGFGVSVRPGTSDNRIHYSINCTQDGNEVWQMMQLTPEYRAISAADRADPNTRFADDPSKDIVLETALNQCPWDKDIKTAVRAHYLTTMARNARALVQIASGGEKTLVYSSPIVRQQPSIASSETWLGIAKTAQSSATALLQTSRLHPMRPKHLTTLMEIAVDYHLPDPQAEREYADQFALEQRARAKSYHELIYPFYSYSRYHQIV